MVNTSLLKLSLVVLIVSAFVIFLNRWHYAPMQEFEEAKKTILKKDRNISMLQNEKKTEVFESRWKAKKEEQIKRKEVKKDEVNLSVGFHTIIFE